MQKREPIEWKIQVFSFNRSLPLAKLCFKLQMKESLNLIFFNLKSLAGNSTQYWSVALRKEETRLQIENKCLAEKVRC